MFQSIHRVDFLGTVWEMSFKLGFVIRFSFLMIWKGKEGGFSSDSRLCTKCC